MENAEVKYVGPSELVSSSHVQPVPIWRKLPLGLMLVVGLPTLMACLYFSVIAAPRYVSEARFIVRSPDKPQLSGAAIALQGVGLSNAQADAFVVHEYITSRDAIADLKARSVDLEQIVSRKEGDIFYRYPRLGESKSAESLHSALGRFINVGYDARTGISTLKVRAFRGDDAQKANEELLQAGERLVNRLNERAARDAVSSAQKALDEAKRELAQVQDQLTQLRRQQGFVDPTLVVSESSEVIGALRKEIAQLTAERDQLRREAPQSPLLPSVERRIAAFEEQVASERDKLTGARSSLTPQLAQYQTLTGAQELAERQLAQATANLVTSRQEAARQQMYLERVASPSVPDAATEPKAGKGILVVLLSSLLVYFIGWLIWAGVREHRQD